MLLTCLDNLANWVINASSNNTLCRFDGGLLQLPVLQQRRDQIAHVRCNRSSPRGPTFCHAEMFKTRRCDTVLKIEWQHQLGNTCQEASIGGSQTAMMDEQGRVWQDLGEIGRLAVNTDVLPQRLANVCAVTPET